MPGGEAIARLAAGGAMAAVDAVMTGATGRAYRARPTARSSRHGRLAMGFCVYNNVVVAARHARRAWGLQRVLILDWDVHHGNGTQDAFDADPSDALHLASTRMSSIPAGWGSMGEVGSGAGEGFTVNIPLPRRHAATPATCEAFQRLVIPVVTAVPARARDHLGRPGCKPMDPLGRMCVTTQGYRDMTPTMIEVADQVCAWPNGRLPGRRLRS